MLLFSTRKITTDQQNERTVNKPELAWQATF